MDREEVKEVIKQQGYRPYIREVNDPRGIGESITYAYAWRHNTGRCLGNLSEIEMMSEEGLRGRLAAKFAEKEATMDLQRIEEIIAEQGCGLQSQERQRWSHRSNQQKVLTLYVTKPGHKRRYLGTLSGIATMTEEDLRQFIDAKFAAKAAPGCHDDIEI